MASFRDEPVGPLLRGHVLGVNERTGVAYLEESEKGRSFKVSSRFVSQEVFQALHEGSRVRFRENGRNAVAAIEIDR